MIEPKTPLPWTLWEYPPEDTEDGNAMTVIMGYDYENDGEGAILAKVNRWSCGSDPPTAESQANAAYIVEACNAYPQLQTALSKLAKLVEQVQTQTATTYVDEWADEIECPGCWWCGGEGCREDCPAKTAIAEAEQLLRKEGE